MLSTAFGGRRMSNSVVGWDPQQTISFVEEAYMKETGMRRGVEIVKHIGEEHAYIFTAPNWVIKEGSITKFNRAGDTSRPHFFLTNQHLVMCELTTLQKKVKFRQVFKLTDIECKVFNGKLRIMTTVKSFECGKGRENVGEWNEQINSAVDRRRREENLPANYAETLELSPMWGANTLGCEICNRNFTVLIRRHHCRNCGKCVCGTCAFEKVRMDAVNDSKLQRVCNVCAEVLKANRAGGYGGGLGYGAVAW
ncbi:hypothetical protein TL16_g06439 [Triparma laevis f. inornata]|uniref:FYVE-type domain-containing protein n=1 Tax=Triparma laevis f. inornata TaxID=1714386 RepID=A0A9W7ASL9_9STRA|nr:hypothetical protein TL16_g06439 [Triparma laevis f. inornata]